MPLGHPYSSLLLFRLFLLREFFQLSWCGVFRAVVYVRGGLDLFEPSFSVHELSSTDHA